ncbi:MAG: hypothetical protein ACR2L3_00860 [Actinomycetota bacterium]
MFRELLASTLWKLRRAQQEAIEEKSDPVERIEEGIRASIAFYRNEPGYLALIRTAARYDAFSGSLKEGQQIVVTDTALHIKEGMAAGSIRHGDPELMAHGILGAIFHFVEVYFGTESGATVDRPQLADEAVAFCLKGVLSP